MDYVRYHLPVEPAPNEASHPDRFQVRVSRFGLAKLLLTELFHTRADMKVVLSRPCLYGVFSGPVGGFAPRSQHCVGCLRCTVEYPDMVEVKPNPGRLSLGDSYFKPTAVDTVIYEASTGRVPVRGAGYRGAFGGEGWDGMWTDMSEIVRPTRDGIHGRETISTYVDLGERPGWLTFDEAGRLTGPLPRPWGVQLPMILDAMPRSAESPALYRSLAEAAEAAQTAAIVPFDWISKLSLEKGHLIPLVSGSQAASLAELGWNPTLVELNGWDRVAFKRLREELPEAIVGVRLPFDTPLDEMLSTGVRVFHLVADYHGQTPRGFVAESIRAVHQTLVEAGLREQVTLIGSGGLVAAEHVPKAILCGLDAVALDTPVLIALQGRFEGEVLARKSASVEMPVVHDAWMVRRVVNLLASWHDQLLEILGAMGMREVRRLRGEWGRAMLQADLEREAFGEIEGFRHG